MGELRGEKAGKAGNQTTEDRVFDFGMRISDLDEVEDRGQVG